MSKIERLLQAYERFVKLPWQEYLSGPEKVWFCIYEPRDERRLRVRLLAFEAATKKAGHGWVLFDVTGRFERWMADHEYHDSYFEDPELLEVPLEEYEQQLADELRSTLMAAGEDTVVAVLGMGSLFGVARVSSVVEQVARGGSGGSIPGRLLVFFPGTRHGSNYRLLDARDGWNYLAVPIEAEGSLA